MFQMDMFISTSPQIKNLYHKGHNLLFTLSFINFLSRCEGLTTALIGQSTITTLFVTDRVSEIITASSIMVMRAVRTSEMSVNFYQVTDHNIPEDSLHTHCHENLTEISCNLMIYDLSLACTLL
jgi:hypothetical protein